MLTIQELFRSVSWADVAESFAELYPDDAEDLPHLKGVFDEVRACRPVPNPRGMRVCVDVVEDEDGSYYDVHGRVPGEEGGYALDLCLFAEWAGSLVDESLLREMRLPEIAAHVLWEMTFCGCTEDDILAHRREIEERLREVQEHPERCVPLSEILKDRG